jgi:hypothetical protein
MWGVGVASQQGFIPCGGGSIMIIEALELETAGVVCLHCGLETPLSNPANQGRSPRSSMAPTPNISIVRCALCGKEAPYLANEIVALKRVANSASHAA